MIHCFTVHGARLVLDAHSQSLHEVDGLAWEILTGEFSGRPETVRVLQERYPAAEIEGALGEIEILRRQGLLFAPDPHPDYQPPPPEVKALCLYVSHHCNLACRYCFARAGRPDTVRKLMPSGVARRAVDLLISESGARRHVEIDFFGGEPLLNFPVVRDTIRYARERGEAAGKRVGFTVTTNGLLLTPEVRRFLLKNKVNVVLSLDGRPEAHDRWRRTPGGGGSHREVLPKIREYVREWEACRGSRGYYYVRGTFTRHNLDFAEDFRYLVEQGFHNVSLEPVVAPQDEEYALRERDLPRVRAEYERLATVYLEAFQADARVRFFHFEIDLDAGPCLPKRLSGCGAGHAYLAVDADGGLFPCHQFVGQSHFWLGDVFSGVARTDLVDAFRQTHVYTKKECSDCWAKFFCSGGCHAHAFLENGSIRHPSWLGCATMRHRLECALYVQARISEITGSKS